MTHQSAGPIDDIRHVPEAIISHVEMDLAQKSQQIRSYNYDLHDHNNKDLRRPTMAAAKTVRSGGITMQRLRVLAINDLKKFSGPERYKD